MQTTTDIAVEREVAIDARPETVWEFLVDPEKAVRWMGVEAVLDARPGGEYRVKVAKETVIGKFVEVDRPRRIVWTWGWEPGGQGSIPPGSTTIEIDLVPDGDGTLLRFRHSGFEAGSVAAERHGHGWDHYLPRLQTAAAGGDPGRDPWRD